jgi:hypothetical protein
LGGSSSTFTPPLAKYLWVNGIQPSSSYRFTSLYVSGSEPAWTLNTSSSLSASGTVIFHYGYILPSVVATGGTITYASGRMFHTFTEDGTFTITRSAGATVEIMAIGGGGGGGSYSGGGGGAGNMIVATGTLSAGEYAVGVGNGGAGGFFDAYPAGNGVSSTFGSNLTALGGGAGASYNIGSGQSGGCGGGATSGDGTGYFNIPGYGDTGTVSSPLTIISNLATNGGEGWDELGVGGTGGGGTSAAGVAQSPPFTVGSAGTNGGAGTLYRGTYYGGGGGGAQSYDDYYGSPYTGGAGGVGGGGNGSSGSVTLVPGTAGAPNTGGGGGGAVGYFEGDVVGLSGGSGIVIVSYVYTG